MTTGGIPPLEGCGFLFSLFGLKSPEVFLPKPVTPPNFSATLPRVLPNKDFAPNIPANAAKAPGKTAKSIARFFSVSKKLSSFFLGSSCFLNSNGFLVNLSIWNCCLANLICVLVRLFWSRISTNIDWRILLEFLQHASDDFTFCFGINPPLDFSVGVLSGMFSFGSIGDKDLNDPRIPFASLLFIFLPNGLLKLSIFFSSQPLIPNIWKNGVFTAAFKPVVRRLPPSSFIFLLLHEPNCLVLLVEFFLNVSIFSSSFDLKLTAPAFPEITDCGSISSTYFWSSFINLPLSPKLISGSDIILKTLSNASFAKTTLWAIDGSLEIESIFSLRDNAVSVITFSYTFLTKLLSAKSLLILKVDESDSSWNFLRVKSFVLSFTAVLNEPIEAKSPSWVISSFSLTLLAQRADSNPINSSLNNEKSFSVSDVNFPLDIACLRILWDSEILLTPVKLSST